jgi:glycosyltransferase involved in cell wall biosynthesis
MKIAHIAPPWIAIPPKNYGGTENVISTLVEEQIAQGHDVTLFAAGDAKTSAKLVSFFPRSLIDTGTPWQANLKAYYHTYKAVEYIKNHDFDIVHTHLSSSGDMYTFPLTTQLTTPMVTTLHSRFPFDRDQSWCGDADDYYMEWMREVPFIAISETARAEVTLPLQFAGVVAHGLQMSHFKPSSEQPEDYLVWLGRFIPEKGAHIAIQVAKATGLPLILAGTIDRHVPMSIAYFERTIKPQIDGRQIKYIGPVGMCQKVDLLSRARVFLNPIEWEEPFGMVMIEAMAVGCPVISFARGAAPSIVADGKSGYLVNTMHEMISALERIDLLDRKLVRAHVQENFSARVMVEKYVRIYQQVRTAHLLKSARLKRSLVDSIAASMPIRSRVTSLELSTGKHTMEPSGTKYSAPLVTQTTLEADLELLH